MPVNDLPDALPHVDPGVAVKSLTDLWMHQNALMWNRIQLLSAVQAGVLASNYVLHKGLVSIFLFLAAAISTLYLNYIWEMDHEIRNIYGARLQKLGFDVGCTADERRTIRIRLLGVGLPVYLNSQISLTGIFWAILVVDASVFVTSLFMFPFL
ncbi:MAG TPA: hypothetical protein VNV38_08245 [Stellaceae bacterium]|jgi:hypothetical protein|nr:hypothetical protein [Stellaceae bacterium]